ncbi:MAG: Type 1 glutamine amidotransferase-like domain-containing protein [Erythrobacter sp.]
MSNSSAFFADPSQAPSFAQYLVRLTGKTCPVIVHVGAANGDSPEKAVKFFELSRRVGFEARHLNLFALDDGDPDSFFAGADAVYVDGGSTRNLRALLIEWSADAALKRASANGVVIAGASAGANILFEWGMTDSIKTRIEATYGLGMLAGSISVHSDARADRGEALARHLGGSNACYPAYALDDGTALHFADGVLKRAISASEGAGIAIGRDENEWAQLPVSLMLQLSDVDRL